MRLDPTHLGPLLRSLPALRLKFYTTKIRNSAAWSFAATIMESQYKVSGVGHGSGLL